MEKEKEAPVYCLIKEVSHITGVNPHTLRHWEKSFPDQLKPRRSGDKNQQRLYSQEDIEVVKKIKQLVQEEKLSIAYTRNLLNGKDSQGMVLLSPKPVPKALTGIMEEINKFKDEYKTDVETIYEALTHIIEQISTANSPQTDSEKTYTQIEKLENLIKNNFDSLQSLKSERKELIKIIEDLRGDRQKSTSEKLAILAQLEDALERKNLFYRISWITGAGVLFLTAAIYWAAHVLK